MSAAAVRIHRVYDPSEEPRGFRVLVDRIWPRGLTKAAADLDEWCKDVAPSSELRRWYGHEPARFDEFRRRYTEELHQPDGAAALAHLRALAKDHELVLLTATKRPDISQAAVLGELLSET